MRKGLYYALAAALLLATVPLYRYILEHASREALAPVPPEAVRPHRWAKPKPKSITVEDLRRAGSSPYYYRLDVDQLPEGYKCTQGGGYVYRTAEVDGATVIDPLVRDGINVQCGY